MVRCHKLVIEIYEIKFSLFDYFITKNKTNLIYFHHIASEIPGKELERVF